MVILPGFGPITRMELNAIEASRVAREKRNRTEANECLSPLFNWSAGKQEISKSVEPDISENSIFNSCFPHL